MASIAVLWRRCIETFKSILSSQSFGSDYEFLCTQLSVQSLRVRLWGESFGLQIQMDSPVNNGVFDRPEIQATVNRCISNIAYLLTEIEALRRRYEVKPRLEAIASEKSKDEGDSTGTRRLTISRPISSFRKRVRDNQRQKSFLAITKWAMSDAKKFDEKVNNVKVLVDGLEDVARAAIFTRTPALGNSRAVGDNPPPYAEFEPTGRRSSQVPSISQLPESSTNAPHDNSLLLHYHAFKIFLTGHPTSSESPRVQPRDKLTRLSNLQLKELRIDVYDDLVRRQHHASTVESLPPNASFHPKRNQAREKLSTLLPHRFRHLATDVMAELTRRFQHLEETPTGHSPRANRTSARPSTQSSQGHGSSFSNASQPSPSLASRRRLHHANNGSPPIQTNPVSLEFTPKSIRTVQIGSGTTQRPTNGLLARIDEDTIPDQADAASRQKEFSTPSLISTFSRSAHPTNSPHTSPMPSLQRSSAPSVEIFKSFRVSMEDPCSKVLPAALKKYNINSPAELYAMYLVYGNVERLMEPDSKPLVEFKRLDKQGKKPMFMLRRVASSSKAACDASGSSVSSPRPLTQYKF